MKFPEHPAALALLSLPAWLYGRAVRLRNLHYDRPVNQHRAGLPVLSVGNLTVGGTGKTPVVAWIAERLISMGRKPAIVSRGYGGRAGRGPRLVSKGQGAVCSAAESGDEAFLLATKIDGAQVFVGSNRLAGAKAARLHGADVVILDDGFQHRRLARDLDIILLDAEEPFGGDRLLPAGPLREPVGAIDRADVVIITRGGSSDRLRDIERRVRSCNQTAPIFRSAHKPAGFFDSSGRSATPPSRAVAFCGIGNPESFRASIGSQGIDIVSFHSYGDHHRYSATEIRELQELARSAGAALVTTEKDLARLDPGEKWPSDPPLTALCIKAEIVETDTFLQIIRTAVEKAAP